jgi:hypothetical protein
LADAALLGRDTRIILHDDSLRDRLIVHMTCSTGVESDTADKLLNQFELGLRMTTL